MERAMIIETQNLCKSFGAIKAVDGINLKIPEGVIVGLLGPNGAGKSTTISMLSTLYKPSSGRILFRGEDVVAKPQFIQPHLGVVPQDIALYPSLSGYENLHYFGSLYGLSGNALKTRIAQVSEVIGITERLRDRVDTYSGGMKRRINIGAALLHRPSLIILDEPTVGIDPQSRNHILEAVRLLKDQGVTVIYTSHYMEEVENLCQQVYIMDRGRVIASGTQDELIEQSGSQTAVHLRFSRAIGNHLDALKQIDAVTAATVESEAEVKLLTRGKGDIGNDIVRQVMNLELGLIAFDLTRPNLENVFLKLTGRGLRD